MNTFNTRSNQNPLISRGFRAKALLLAFVAFFCATGEAAKGGNGGGNPGGESSPPEITSINNW